MNNQDSSPSQQTGKARPRKSNLASKALLATGVASLLLAVLGKGKAHAIAGIAFALLAADHVRKRWQRI